MAVRQILLLGNPALYERATPVREDELAAMAAVVADLHDTLLDFRARHGVGRAIAAPQIGVPRRLVYVHVGEALPLFNPAISDASDEMMVVWDDCMSFPDLLVRVSRHRRCCIVYRDAQWRPCSWPVQDAMAELLQHEIDHLDGILAVQRAIDGRSFCLRSEWRP